MVVIHKREKRYVASFVGAGTTGTPIVVPVFGHNKSNLLAKPYYYIIEGNTFTMFDFLKSSF